MPKLKSHKGLLKRIKVTATGKVKTKKSSTGHLKSNKNGDKIRLIREDHYVKGDDIKRFERMLHRRLKAG
ncbi:MAG: 50S ribosomal protein L35 [Phycisphaeraceae bacterium]|nr:50S ribosomal protein L35 [Phycisphaeraceae bacterium]